MPLPSKVWDRCRAFLQPGEELRYLFPASSVGLGRWGIAGTAPFLVAVSDTHITVLSCEWLRRHRPASVWARHPRATRLGPVDTSMAPTLEISDLVLEIDEEYLAVVQAADAELDGTDRPPPDPLPDL
jgi:hypothetical protein